MECISRDLRSTSTKSSYHETDLLVFWRALDQRVLAYLPMTCATLNFFDVPYERNLCTTKQIFVSRIEREAGTPIKSVQRGSTTTAVSGFSCKIDHGKTHFNFPLASLSSFFFIVVANTLLIQPAAYSQPVLHLIRHVFATIGDNHLIGIIMFCFPLF